MADVIGRCTVSYNIALTGYIKHDVFRANGKSFMTYSVPIIALTRIYGQVAPSGMMAVTWHILGTYCTEADAHLAMLSHQMDDADGK